MHGDKNAESQGAVTMATMAQRRRVAGGVGSTGPASDGVDQSDHEAIRRTAQGSLAGRATRWLGLQSPRDMAMEREFGEVDSDESEREEDDDGLWRRREGMEGDPRRVERLPPLPPPLLLALACAPPLAAAAWELQPAPLAAWMASSAAAATASGLGAAAALGGTALAPLLAAGAPAQALHLLLGTVVAGRAVELASPTCRLRSAPYAQRLAFSAVLVDMRGARRVPIDEAVAALGRAFWRMVLAWLVLYLLLPLLLLDDDGELAALSARLLQLAAAARAFVCVVALTMLSDALLQPLYSMLPLVCGVFLPRISSDVMSR